MENKNLEQTTRKERFKGFALSHFVISIVGFCVAYPAALLLSGSDLFSAAAVAGTAALQLAYAFAGGWQARKRMWTRPRTFREGLWAFLAPALVAWGWAALVIGSVSLPFVEVLFPLVFWGSFLLALPSSLLVFLILVFGSALFEYSMVPGLLLTGFLAGAIPPLLFLLGSLWGSRGSKGPGPGEAEETEERV